MLLRDRAEKAEQLKGLEIFRRSAKEAAKKPRLLMEDDLERARRNEERNASRSRATWAARRDKLREKCRQKRDQ